MINKVPDYSDIICLPHPEPKYHKRMSASERAAQFAPFDALTGYEDSLRETARLTDAKFELDESEKEKMDFKLQIIKENLETKPVIKITYFIADQLKKGGQYKDIFCTIKRIDDYNRFIVLEDGDRISCDDIYNLESDIFPDYI